MNQFKDIVIRAILLVIILAGSGFSSMGQTIDELLAMAVNENPELRALELEYEAALLKGPQVSQLPAPQIGFAAPVLRPETRVGSQVFGVSASQMFPWFGTLKAREDVVLTMAQSKYERITAIRLELFYRIKVAYDKLWTLGEQQQIIRENIRIYEVLKEVSLAKVESGKTTLSDVLRIQVKIQDLEKELEILENQKLRYYARINEVVNRTPTDTIEVLTQLDTAIYLPPDFQLLKSRIEENHPIINQLDWAIESSKKEIEANRLSGLPSFGVGLDYSMVKPRTDAFPIDNGGDILIPKISLSIPIYRKKYRAKEQEEIVRQEALGFQKENVVNKYTRLLEEFRTDFEDAGLKLELYQLQSETLQSTLNILLDYYSSHGDRFEEILQVQDKILSYDIASIKAIAQKHIARAGIDQLTDF